LGVSAAMFVYGGGAGWFFSKKMRYLQRFASKNINNHIN
jgi:hypothetical protein